MEWQMVLILVIVIAIVAIPAALIWYINVAGIFHVMADARARKRALRKAQVAAVKEE